MQHFKCPKKVIIHFNIAGVSLLYSKLHQHQTGYHFCSSNRHQSLHQSNLAKKQLKPFQGNYTTLSSSIHCLRQEIISSPKARYMIFEGDMGNIWTFTNFKNAPSTKMEFLIVRLNCKNTPYKSPSWFIPFNYIYAKIRVNHQCSQEHPPPHHLVT